MIFVKFGRKPPYHQISRVTLKEMFSKFGEIQNTIVPWKNEQQKKLQPYGYIKFMNTESVELALDSDVYYGHILFLKERAIKSVWEKLNKKDIEEKARIVRENAKNKFDITSILAELEEKQKTEGKRLKKMNK